MKLSQKRKWNNADYKLAAKHVKPFSALDIDLRKGYVSPKHRAQIRRLYNEAVNAGIENSIHAKIFKPRRKPKESNSAYKKRLTQIKNKVGQTGTGLNGIVLSVPEHYRVRIRGTDVLLASSITEEKIFPFQYIGDYLANEIELDNLVAQIQSEGFHSVQPLVGISRGPEFGVFDEDEIDRLETALSGWGTQYGSITEWFKGFVAIRFRDLP